jgi:uncharacterized membrane protein YgcG
MLRTRHFCIVGARRNGARAFTLLEISLVVGLLVIITGFSWPYLQNHIMGRQLPESAEQFRSLLHMSRATAMLDGKRFRIRFEPEAHLPIVEYEKDPFLEPGVFVPVRRDWTTDDRLLGDVHVHEIRLGRPDYTRPYDEAAEARLAEEDTFLPDDQAAQEDAGTSGAVTTLMYARATDDPIDERRPPIVFETDGSTGWATVIIARAPPSDPLEEDDPQIWIEIDGRTGLAAVREALTEHQLTDASWRIPREKLEPPEIVFGEVDDMGEMQSQGQGFELGGLGSSGGMMSGEGQFGGGGRQGSARRDGATRFDRPVGGEPPESNVRRESERSGSTAQDPPQPPTPPEDAEKKEEKKDDDEDDDDR